MGLFYKDEEMVIKIGYYGPGLAGKTTSIQYIYDTTEPSLKRGVTATFNEKFGHLLSCKIATKERFNHKKLVLHLVAKVGNLWSKEAEIAALKDVDGIIFIVDSQIERMDANIEWDYLLTEIFAYHNYHMPTMAYALQINKRDLPNKMSVASILEELNYNMGPVFETIAYKGIGVFDPLKAVVKQVLSQRSALLK